jgi:sugar lactone lactonase YvrE
MAMSSTPVEPNVLLDGLAMVESPRWHDAEGLGPDAICLDADGAIWVGTADTRISTGREDSPAGAVVRIRQGGEVLNRIEHGRPILGCALGGPDRKTLFLLATQWRGAEQVAQVVAARTGQVLTAQAPAPGVGWP